MHEQDPSHSFGSMSTEQSSKALMTQILQRFSDMQSASNLPVNDLPRNNYQTPDSLPAPVGIDDLDFGQFSRVLSGMPSGDASPSPPGIAFESELPGAIQHAAKRVLSEKENHPIAHGVFQQSLQQLHLDKGELRRFSFAKGSAHDGKYSIPHSSEDRLFASPKLVSPHLPASSFRQLDVDSIRSEFPVLNQSINGHDLIWFDNAATTHKPSVVIEAMSSFYARDYSNIHRAAHTLAARATDHYEAARETAQEFIHAQSASDIVFVRGTTEGINFIANTCASFLQEGDEILLAAR